ncbi:hypothetical protein Ae201684P_006977 [Aphanomyces euteiches]|nr:hypothetical protein Ae201684P_006977 [Aphanomyces euteiches]KAH9134889.1 hypothetical protein AeRB84_019459 [Aphanomyces euteiches]
MYLLADGIYPSSAHFQKPISNPVGNKQKLYAKRQAALRKDVERCFGVLFGRFHILANPGRFWSRDTMHAVWKACIILHNIIIEDETDTSIECTEWPSDLQREPISFNKYVELKKALKNERAHYDLRNDLIEHLWSMLAESILDE